MNTVTPSNDQTPLSVPAPPAPAPREVLPPTRPGPAYTGLREATRPLLTEALAACGLAWLPALTRLGGFTALVALGVAALKTEGLDPGLRAMTVVAVALTITILGLATPAKGPTDATTTTQTSDKPAHT